jgi:hypothetical protein
VPTADVDGLDIEVLRRPSGDDAFRRGVNGPQEYQEYQRTLRGFIRGELARLRRYRPMSLSYATGGRVGFGRKWETPLSFR